ncbi:MAG TPA: hypothetical protein VMS22_24810 [Candidatus Eisenbacteria bacterium]|nr:hypothetical protein [Candidatus Eisenbacteria bacterium]
MRRSLSALVVSFAASFPLLLSADAHAHATYNLSGYGSGLGGSTNGADGTPADPSATWTNGPPEEYGGALPAQWYCGLHNATQVRPMQTGAGANPPSDSLLAQVATYNGTNDPDLPTDRVLAVGGLSWTDPANGDQGWGHGLDYGVIHVTPLDTIEENGPVKLTLTLSDDPTDDVAVTLAYAIYGGWDTSTTATRHQTFTTNPAPIDNPLGSSGLKLIDFAVATGPGVTLSRSYDLDPAYEGKYTVFIGALGGVAGQYQLTAGLFPAGADTNAQLSQCQDDLAAANSTITTMTADADGDGVPDARDRCATTPAGQFVDDGGCSQAQFCAAFTIAKKSDRKLCKELDWKNDEPNMKPKQADCTFSKASSACAATAAP